MNNGTIIYIGGFELPDKNAAAHRVLNNAKALRDNGKRVILIGIDKSLSWANDILNTRTNVQGFESYAIPYPNSKRQWIGYLSDINALDRVINSVGKIESIIFYNYQSIALCKAMRYCRSKGIKAIADVTEWYSAQGNGFAFAVIKGFDTWFRMRVLQKHMDGLIVISRYLQKYYRKCKNVVYIPALTDLSEEKWDRRACVKSNGDPLRIVYAGSPGSHKDHLEYLVAALTGVKRRIHLDIIGVTKDDYCTNHPEHAKFLEHNDSVVFHGRVSHLEALKFVKEAHYSCFFRNDERVTKAGFPTKFAEAITCGTPVITNQTSNLGEYISNGNNGYFVDSLDSRAIVKCLSSVKNCCGVDSTIFDYKRYSNAVFEWMQNIE